MIEKRHGAVVGLSEHQMETGSKRRRPSRNSTPSDAGQVGAGPPGRSPPPTEKTTTPVPNTTVCARRRRRDADCVLRGLYRLRQNN
jgi:hypothetical protein